jgi:hypothetical protein
MLRSRFGPLAAAFCFCVMLADPLAVEVITCDWLSAPEAQSPEALAFWTVLAPVCEFWVIEIDWCASSVTVTGMPLLAVVEPSTFVVCRTQAVFAPESAV